jgi:GLPGLI family protein
MKRIFLIIMTVCFIIMGFNVEKTCYKKKYFNADIDTAYAIGKAKYRMITKLRLIQLEQPAELIFGRNESVFIHSRGKEGFTNQDILSNEESETGDNIQDGWYQDEIGSIYYKNFIKNELIIREIVWQQPYLTTEPSLPKITWQISGEQKMIGKFLCQKAETKFRGRNYSAWFTTEIPVSDGPWKFYGLPGLILEVSDDKNEVQFELESIQMPCDSAIIIEPPQNGKKISFENYKRADDIEFEKAKKRFLSENKDRNSTSEFTRINKNLIEKEF